jgi:PRC-barrel domain
VADDERQIAWRALERGTRVYSSDGAQLGKVSHVVADDLKDIFSGIAFSRGMLGEEVFAPAPLVDTITSDGVHLTLTHEEAERELGPYDV